MKHYITLFFHILLLASGGVTAQINAVLLQQPDVSETHITFVYAGDIWTVPIAGGTASRLTSPAGEESFAKIYTDGK